MEKGIEKKLIHTFEILSELNNLYKSKIEKNTYENEPELIVKNTLAMCEIANYFKS